LSQGSELKIENEYYNEYYKESAERPLAEAQELFRKQHKILNASINTKTPLMTSRKC
jgi:hypothetical protein